MASRLEDFEILDKLGDGAYSSVFKVYRRKSSKMVSNTNTTLPPISDNGAYSTASSSSGSFTNKYDPDRIYALKKVRMPTLTEKERTNALNEVRLLASIQHKNIIAFRDSFFDSHYLCVITEYADLGDVYQLICRIRRNKHQSSQQSSIVGKSNEFVNSNPSGTFIPENEILIIFSEAAVGLKALHDLNILHRDLKSANVFLTSNFPHVKIGDFNVSKVAKSERKLSHTQTGTPYYASPEVWRDAPYDTRSDVWSLGVVLYEMCALIPPFTGKNMDQLFKLVTRAQFTPIDVSRYSRNLSRLTTRLLTVSTSCRPTMSEVLTIDIVVQTLRDHRIKCGVDPGDWQSKTTQNNRSSTIRPNPQRINRSVHQPRQQSANQAKNPNLLETIKMGGRLPVPNYNNEFPAKPSSRLDTIPEEQEPPSVQKPMKYPKPTSGLDYLSAYRKARNNNMEKIIGGIPHGNPSENLRNVEKSPYSAMIKRLQQNQRQNQYQNRIPSNYYPPVDRNVMRQPKQTPPYNIYNQQKPSQYRQYRLAHLQKNPGPSRNPYVVNSNIAIATRLYRPQVHKPPGLNPYGLRGCSFIHFNALSQAEYEESQRRLKGALDRGNSTIAQRKNCNCTEKDTSLSALSKNDRKTKSHSSLIAYTPRLGFIKRRHWLRS